MLERNSTHRIRYWECNRISQQHYFAFIFSLSTLKLNQKLKITLHTCSKVINYMHITLSMPDHVAEIENASDIYYESLHKVDMLIIRILWHVSLVSASVCINK